MREKGLCGATGQGVAPGVSFGGCPRQGSHGWPWGESILEDSLNPSPAAVGWCGQKREAATQMHRETCLGQSPGVWLPASCVLDTAQF